MELKFCGKLHQAFRQNKNLILIRTLHVRENVTTAKKESNNKDRNQ
jgi:hypothetical protein